MNVYLLSRNHFWDGSETQGIYSTLEDAQDFAQQDFESGEFNEDDMAVEKLVWEKAPSGKNWFADITADDYGSIEFYVISQYEVNE